MRTVNGKDKLGLAVLVVTLLGGAWLVAAPFLVGHQDRGADWTVATTSEFFVGLGLVAVAVTTGVVFAANALRELAQRPSATSSNASRM